MSRATSILFALSVLLFAAPAAQAQNAQGFDPNELMRMMQNPEEMQRMADQAKAAEKCMAGIEQSDLDALERKAREAQSEIERLCKEGKREQALAEGVTLAREMAKDETVVTLRECTKELGETMKKIVPMSIPGIDDDSEPTESDICD